MATPNPYSNLHFEKWVDWEHVNPTLLAKVNSIAKSRGEIVDVTSGYRSPSYNAKVGGAEHSQHTNGLALDAYVNGQPIGDVWSADVFQKAGLRTGNQPNFFKGKPDPEHVDMGLQAGDSPVTSYGTPDQQQAPSQQPAPPAAADLVQTDMANSSSIGPPVGPNVIVANDGTQPYTNSQNLPPRFQTWQMLAQLPGASPDTMKLAQMAGYENANH